MRVDPATELLGVRVNIWMSLVLIAFGIGWFLWGGWRRRPTDSDYPYVDGSARTEPGADGVAEGGPSLEGPGPEVAVGEADAGEVDLGVDPEEGA